MIKVDGLVLGRGRLVDQLVGCRVVEIEAPLDDAVELVASAPRHSPSMSASAVPDVERPAGERRGRPLA